MYSACTWHLGIDSSADLDDRYSNLFLNAYINRHAHTEYLKMIEVYSPLGIWHVFLYSINTNIYHFRSMKYRQYAYTNRRIHLPVCYQQLELILQSQSQYLAIAVLR